jgi:hypothetical protein
MLLLLAAVLLDVCTGVQQTCTGSSTKLPQAQCEAWGDVYDAANGDRWSCCNGMKTDPCSCMGWDWNYNASDPATFYPHCDTTNSTVTRLHLPFQNVRGSLPPSLGKLTDLQGISMRGNFLTGQIPTSIGALTKLTLFDVSQELEGGGGGFTGAVPQSMSNCTKLTQFLVGGHHLGGGGLLPAIPFDNMGWGSNGSGCQLFDVRHSPVPSNRFRCPWPAGAKEHCFKVNVTTSGTWTSYPITDADCSMYSCNATAGQCVESPSGKQTAEDCIATCKSTPKPTPPPTPVCPVPLNCGLHNNTDRCAHKFTGCDVCDTCCHPWLDTDEICSGCVADECKRHRECCVSYECFNGHCKRAFGSTGAYTSFTACAKACA